MQDSRYLHRGRMPWDLAERIDDPETSEAQIFRGLARLEALRKENKAFSAQADFWTFDTGSNFVLGLGRWLEDKGVIGLFNFGDADRSVSLENGEVTVPAGDYLWINL